MRRRFMELLAVNGQTITPAQVESVSPLDSHHILGQEGPWLLPTPLSEVGSTIRERTAKRFNASSSMATTAGTQNMSSTRAQTETTYTMPCTMPIPSHIENPVAINQYFGQPRPNTVVMPHAMYDRPYANAAQPLPMNRPLLWPQIPTNMQWAWPPLVYTPPIQMVQQPNMPMLTVK